MIGWRLLTTGLPAWLKVAGGYPVDGHSTNG